MKKTKSLHSGTADLRIRIIKTALSCFIEKGFAATGIGDICKKSDISVGSLYHHFKSKEQLAGAVYIEASRDNHATELPHTCLGGQSRGLATHSLTRVVLPKPAGAEMRVNLRPEERPLFSCSTRRGRRTRLDLGGGT